MTLVRCDDIFVDSDVTQFEKICQIIRRFGFDHIIGITPIGEGKALWTARGKKLWNLPVLHRTGLFNYGVGQLTGEKPIGNNKKLLSLLGMEFAKYSAIPALHGLHHYRYNQLRDEEVHSELSLGKSLLRGLLNVDVKVFVPPFNAWNHNTEQICSALGLSIDKCTVGFDKMIEEMKPDDQIVQLAKEQSSMPEVLYHPYRLASLEKFELYLKIRRKYC